MSETNGETKVTFTVKELLQDMDVRHSKQLDDIEAKVSDIGSRVEKLERADEKEDAIRKYSSRLIGAAALVGTICISLVNVLISAGRIG